LGENNWNSAVQQVWQVCVWSMPVVDIYCSASSNSVTGTGLNSLVLPSVWHFLKYLFPLSKLINVTALHCWLCCGQKVVTQLQETKLSEEGCSSEPHLVTGRFISQYFPRKEACLLVCELWLVLTRVGVFQVPMLERPAFSC
jgi:hypothetical protein